MWIKARKIMCVFLFSVVLVIANSSIVYAEQVLPDLNRKDCSITVCPRSIDSHEVVKNTEFSAWRVGEAEIHEGALKYVLTEEFTESGADLSNLKAEGLIEKLQNYAENNGVQGIRQRANGKGEVTFRNLPTGLYLLKQDAAAEDHETVLPFLVTVPMESLSGGEWIYYVDATPKAEFEKAEESLPKPDASLPQTGQLNWPIPVLAAAGIALFALGYGLHMKRR